MRDDKRSRNLAKIEEMQRRSHERLDSQRVRIEKRFDRMREHAMRDTELPNDSQQRIINAALELLNEDGLNNLSLRKLASKIDMQAPAIYWHFKNKERLIDYLAEEILHREFSELTPRQADQAWQEWLMDVCKRLRQAMRSHRDGARIVAGAHLFPAVTLLRLFEMSFMSLTSAGLNLRDANLITSTAIHFTFGRVIEEQSSPTVDELKETNIDELLVDYPLMRESIIQNTSHVKSHYDEFDASLRLIIGSAN
jgi:TetR/AcrR family tetracycline transcriptional repressor